MLLDNTICDIPSCYRSKDRRTENVGKGNFESPQMIGSSDQPIERVLLPDLKFQNDEEKGLNGRGTKLYLGDKALANGLA